MRLRHRVHINVTDNNGNKSEVLRSTHMRLPERLLKVLFGDFCEVLVLMPGETVDRVTVQKTGRCGHD